MRKWKKTFTLVALVWQNVLAGHIWCSKLNSPASTHRLHIESTSKIIIIFLLSGIENPSRSELIGRCDGDEKTEWPRRIDKSRTIYVFNSFNYSWSQPSNSNALSCVNQKGDIRFRNCNVVWRVIHAGKKSCLTCEFHIVTIVTMMF